MGGGDSHEVQHHHHYTTVIKNDPVLEATVKEQEAKILVIEEEARKAHDPQLYVTNMAKQFDEFVDKLPTLTLTDIIQKQTGETHIGIIGPVSAGKTSFINALYNKNLPVAMSHCTDKCEVVHKEKLTCVWDLVGTNNDFKFYDPTNLSFIKSLDKCVILFCDDINMISNILKVIYAIKQEQMIIVRTKCDTYSANNLRTIAQECALDTKKVRELLDNQTIQTYCISSNNIINKQKEHFDWNKVKELL